MQKKTDVPAQTGRLDMTVSPQICFSSKIILGEYYYDLGLGKKLFIMTQKAPTAKENIDIFDYIKIKNFAHQKIQLGLPW